MAKTERKTFGLSRETIRVIEERDRSVYRHEYQFVEAAIQNFSRKNDEADGKQMTEHTMQKYFAEILQEIKEVQKELKTIPRGAENREIHTGGIPDKLEKIFD